MSSADRAELRAHLADAGEHGITRILGQLRSEATRTQVEADRLYTAADAAARDAEAANAEYTATLEAALELHGGVL